MSLSNSKALGLGLATCLLFSGLAHDAQAQATDASINDAHEVSIMTFNVENLFDNRNDPGKVDETYLAVEDKQSDEHIAECNIIEVDRWRDQCLNWDWSDEIIERKLRVVAAAILQVNNGSGPDILALQEVENRAILERLRSDYLGAANYRPPILIEGHDARGIDVAFLSRLELAEPVTLYPIPFEDVDDKRIADTRGALEATFVLPNGGLLTGYSVHFPAPFHPTIMREFAYKHLNELRRNLPDDRPAFAAGDFNTTGTEDHDKSMLDRFARPDWTVVHDEPCDGCRGTTYYRRNEEWSYLDMILWSPAKNRGENATWGIRAKSMQIANHTSDQILADGTPARFQLPAGTGVSDHWPVIFTIENK